MKLKIPPSMRQLEKWYQGGDAEERSSLKVKEVFAKMQRQFFDGVLTERKNNSEDFRKFLKEVKELVNKTLNGNKPFTSLYLNQKIEQIAFKYFPLNVLKGGVKNEQTRKNK